MSNHDASSALSEIIELALHRVTGGAEKLDFNAIRAQAQAYCPATAARYGNVNPDTVTRPVAQRMANQCLTEMGPFKALFARGPIERAIDEAYPAPRR